MVLPHLPVLSRKEPAAGAPAFPVPPALKTDLVLTALAASDPLNRVHNLRAAFLFQRGVLTPEILHAYCMWLHDAVSGVLQAAPDEISGGPARKKNRLEIARAVAITFVKKILEAAEDSRRSGKKTCSAALGAALSSLCTLIRVRDPQLLKRVSEIIPPQPKGFAEKPGPAAPRAQQILKEVEENPSSFSLAQIAAALKNAEESGGISKGQRHRIKEHVLFHNRLELDPLTRLPGEADALLDCLYTLQPKRERQGARNLSVLREMERRIPTRQDVSYLGYNLGPVYARVLDAIPFEKKTTGALLSCMHRFSEILVAAPNLTDRAVDLCQNGQLGSVAEYKLLNSLGSLRWGVGSPRERDIHALFQRTASRIVSRRGEYLHFDRVLRFIHAAAMYEFSDVVNSLWPLLPAAFPSITLEFNQGLLLYRVATAERLPLPAPLHERILGYVEQDRERRGKAAAASVDFRSRSVLKVLSELSMADLFPVYPGALRRTLRDGPLDVVSEEYVGGVLIDEVVRVPHPKIPGETFCIAIEYDGPVFHLINQDDHYGQPGADHLKDRIVRNLGLGLLRISGRKWRSMDTSRRPEFLARELRKALSACS